MKERKMSKGKKAHLLPLRDRRVRVTELVKMLQARWKFSEPPAAEMELSTNQPGDRGADSRISDRNEPEKEES